VSDATIINQDEHPKLTAKDYTRDLKPVWCPGCGNFGVLTALTKAFEQLQVHPENTAIISGIGCSSRLPGYVKTYGFNTLHGRALPIATGVRMARPDATVLVVSGDGDAFSIGMGHFPHAARRNINLTMMVLDNNIYGLTKGQASPTTPIKDKTKTTSMGNVEMPFNPCRLALSVGVTFVAKGFAGDIKHLSELVTAAIKHKGFSFIQVISPCVTYRGMQQMKELRPLIQKLDATHDTSDLGEALKVTLWKDQIYTGIYFQHEITSMMHRVQELQEMATAQRDYEMADIMDRFIP
jgi:2-oxoglutarate/2-oxoacid ferredoxin oxidoreductase subunit beta